MAHNATMTPRTLQEGQGFRVALEISDTDNVAGEVYELRAATARTGLILDVSTATIGAVVPGVPTILTFHSNHGYPAACMDRLNVFKASDPLTVLETVPVVVTAAASPAASTPLSASIIGPAAGAVLHGVSNVVMAGAGGADPYLYVLLVDGTVVYSGPGNTFAWDTAPFANGAHELRLTVQDSAGARASSPGINVIVSNAVVRAVRRAVVPPPPTPWYQPGPQVRSGLSWGLAILTFVIPTVLACGVVWWLWSEVKSGLNEFPKGADPITVPAGTSGSGSTNNGPVQSCTLGSTCINNQPPASPTPGSAAPTNPTGSGSRPPPPPPPSAGTSGIGPAGGWHQWPSPCRLKAGGSC